MNTEDLQLIYGIAIAMGGIWLVIYVIKKLIKAILSSPPED